MKVFVGNYPFDLEEEELREVLLPYGLSGLEFVRDPGGASRGFAFAELERWEEAVKDLDERIIGGRELRVCRAVER
jgi:RNA recognition motif-containing protein